jgi:hypothetical protein
MVRTGPRCHAAGDHGRSSTHLAILAKFSDFAIYPAGICLLKSLYSQRKAMINGRGIHNPEMETCERFVFWMDVCGIKFQNLKILDFLKRFWN